ncbi:MAG: HAAS signaling domain-containing protein [Acholeplasmataceae bacterium]
MKQFIKTLEKELDRYFYQSEVQEILAYYEEMILERQDQGEALEDIINSYDVKAIMQHMAPHMILKREKTVKNLSNSAWLILLVLLSTPLLLPLGITFVILLLVAVILVFTGGVIFVSGAISFVAFIVSFLVTTVPIENRFVMLGSGLIAVGVLSVVGVLFIIGFKWVFTQLIVGVSRLIQSYGGRK